MSQRNDQDCHEYGSQVNAGCKLENKTGRLTVDGTLFKQAGEVFQGLENAGPFPAGGYTFGPDNEGNSGVRSFFRPTEFYFLVIVVVNSINMGCSGSNKPI